MSRSDRLTILLSVAALCVTLVGTSCSTNARIDDLNASMNARIDDLNASLNARIDDLSASVDARFEAVRGEVRAVREELRELRALVIDAIKTATAAD